MRGFAHARLADDPEKLYRCNAGCEERTEVVLEIGVESSRSVIYLCPAHARHLRGSLLGVGKARRILARKAQDARERGGSST